MRKTLIAGAAILALSFGVVACGSDDDSGNNGSEETLTKAELTTQADALCTEFDAEAAQLAGEAFPDGEPNEQELNAWVTDDIVPLYRDQVEQLRELQPDEATAEEWNDIVDTLESELNELEADPQLAASEEGPFAEATAKAKDFGLEVCGAD